MIGLQLALITFTCVCYRLVNGYPTGAPTDACISMQPQHGDFAPQNSPSPYSVRVARNGDEFTVSLVDDSGSTPFRGFLLQARNIALSSIVGQFTTVPTSSAQLISCLAADNSVTHINNDLKQSVQFTWNSRGADISGVQIVATVVQRVDTYWMNIYSPDLAAVADDPCSSYELVSREEWNARPPTSIQYLEPPVNMTFVHHTAGRPCFDKATCISYVNSIQSYHMDSNGWADIGYSFLIGEDGRAYQGRGWNVVGAHTASYNTVALGFSILGDFMRSLPNDLALTTTKNLIACGVKQGYITENYELFGHRDGRCTNCPGDQLYAEIRTWPQYSLREIPIYCLAEDLKV